MEWTEDKTFRNSPAAVLRDGDRVVMKVYLSPQQDIIRIVLVELQGAAQLKIDASNHIIDFRRKP